MTRTKVLSMLLIPLTLVSYLPQYLRLLAVRSSAGIPISASFLNSLVAQAQVATMCYLFKSAPLMRYGTPINTPPSARDWLNLTQVLVQWCCSLLYHALVTILPAAPISSQSASAVGNTAISKWSTAMGLVLHFSLFLVSISAGGRYDSIIFNIIRNLNAGIANPLLTVLAVVAFVIQARVTWHTQESDALSELTLVLQTAVFLLLAISWPFRLILPPNMWSLGHQPAVLLEWYPWVGWACVNSVVVAIGQAIVLYAACQGRGGNFWGNEISRAHQFDAMLSI